MTRQMSALALLLWTTHAPGAPQVSGTPEELRALLGLAEPALRTLTIRGTAEETASTDRAVVSLVVTTESRSMAEALELNATLRRTINGQITGAGVDAAAIKTSRFSTSPQFGMFGRNPSSYQVVNRMEVTVTDETQLAALGRIADQYQEVSFGGTEFEHSEKQQFEDKVRQAAVEDAMAERRFYEQALGLRLTPVTFRGGPVVFAPQARLEGAIEEIVVTANRVRSGAGGDEDDRSGSYAAEAVPTFDEIRYSAAVDIDFEIQPVQ